MIQVKETSLLKTGAWRVAEGFDVYVIVEVYPHAAYAYLWAKSGGIRSHVWLFNCEAEGTASEERQDDAVPPEMPANNIRDTADVPLSIDDISCVFNVIASTWDLYWAGHKMAVLSEKERPGRSALVKVSNELANTL